MSRKTIENNGPFADISDDDIRAELKRRERERHRFNEVAAHSLTKDMVDAFRPDHDEDDCTDENENGFQSGDFKHMPLCMRCALLQLVDGVRLPEGFRVVLCID